MGDIMSWGDIKISGQTGNMKCFYLWKGGRHIVYGMVFGGVSDMAWQCGNDGHGDLLVTFMVL